MVKYLSAVVLLAILGAISFVQPAVAVVDEAVYFTGKIDSIDSLDPDIGVTTGSIYAVDAADKETRFFINTDTEIYDENSKPIESRELDNGDTVTIKYCKTDQGNAALVINLKR